MTKYENYTPEIPYEEELPPASTIEDSGSDGGNSSGTKKKKGKPEKKQRPKKEKPQKAPKTTGSDNDMLFNRLKALLTSQNLRLISGLILVGFGLYLLIVFISYFSSCISDQSIVANSQVGTAKGISNAGGEGGARLGEFLINGSFGLGSAVIIFWLFAVGMKALTGYPRFKTLNFTIKALIALITVSLIIGLLTIGFNSSVNWGGYHGRFVNEFIIQFVGWSGAVILSLVMVGIFVIICLRDFIKWIIRMKRKADEKRHAIMAARAEARRRKEEIEEMRRREAMDEYQSGETAAAITETEQPSEEEQSKMSFHYENDSPFEYGESYVIPDDLPEDTSESNLYGNPHTYSESEREEEPKDNSEDTTEDNYNLDSAEDSTDSEQPTTEQEVKEEEKSENTEVNDPAMVINVNSISTSPDGKEHRPYDPNHRIPYTFPPTEYLRPGENKVPVDVEEQMANKDLIRRTLLDYGIPIVSIEATVGPTVTLYEIRPDKGVKIAKIRNLVDDIAMALAAIGVRIIAPIPGRGTVGIEVANKDPQTVSMRTVLQSNKFRTTKYELPVAIGCTISNDVYIADLTKMPHLLVAGATGQGKSVGLNAIITSLLYSKRPDEVKFVMIDPKMVEFSLYAKIERHYLAKIPGCEQPIITDKTKVAPTLSSLVVEMENRYTLLSRVTTRNIVEYNKKYRDGLLNENEGHRYLPYIVVVVDEFSDLIMTSGKEVETPIVLLGQKARAVGIHVILATQRPSADVITGLIKANFPTRMAFRVSSGVDSKTILDASGAQQLIGRGDMLVSNNSDMVRVQCAFIDTPEVEQICDYIERQPYGQGAYILPEPVIGEGEEDDLKGANNFNEVDPLFKEVARLVVSSNTASTSSLQRRYNIGYNRAGRIMDQLEAYGIVGPAQGGKPRQVLIDPMQLDSILDSIP